MRASPKNITSIGFQSDGKWMYSGGEDGSVRIWDLRARNLQCQRLLQTSNPINCLALHPNQTEAIHRRPERDYPYLGPSEWCRPNGTIGSGLRHINTTHSIETEGNQLSAVDNRGNCYIFALKT